MSEYCKHFWSGNPGTQECLYCHDTRPEPKREPMPTGTEAAVCKDIASRQALGIQKYGQTVAENPLAHKQWLQHAYEECLDQAVYLKRAIQELEP